MESSNMARENEVESNSTPIYSSSFHTGSVDTTRSFPLASTVACLVCYNPHVNILLEPCHHQFHIQCVDRWLNKDKVCPVCWIPIQTHRTTYSSPRPSPRILTTGTNILPAQASANIEHTNPPNVRKGKWTNEETAYCDRLIEEFKKGNLPLAEGTTLRTFLSKLLNCDPMRISKKYTGDMCIGKIIFRRREQALEIKEMEQIRQELAELEKTYLDREQYNQRRREKRLESESTRERNRFLTSPTVYQPIVTSSNEMKPDTISRISSIDSFASFFPRVASIDGLDTSYDTTNGMIKDGLSTYFPRVQSLENLSNLLSNKEKSPDTKQTSPNQFKNNKTGIFPRVSSIDKLPRIPSMDTLPEVSNTCNKIPRVPSMDSQLSRVSSSNDMFTMSTFPSFSNLSGLSTSSSFDKLNTLVPSYRPGFPRNSSIEDILSLVASSESEGPNHSQLAIVIDDRSQKKRKVQDSITSAGPPVSIVEKTSRGIQPTQV